MMENQTMLLSEYANYRHMSEEEIKKCCEEGILGRVFNQDNQCCIELYSPFLYDNQVLPFNNPVASVKSPFLELLDTKEEFLENFIVAFTQANAPIVGDLSIEEISSIYNGYCDSDPESFLMDDVAAVNNHFEALNFLMIERNRPLDLWFVKKLHSIVFNTLYPPFETGEFRAISCPESNVAGEKVEKVLEVFLEQYNGITDLTPTDVDLFRQGFMEILPFSEGSDTIANLLCFKELFAHHLIPLKYLNKKEFSEKDWLHMYLPDKED